MRAHEATLSRSARADTLGVSYAGRFVSSDRDSESAIMMDLVNRNPSPTELRKFGITVLVGLAVIGSLVLWWKGNEAFWLAASIWAVGGTAAVLTIAAPPAIGRRVYVWWMLAGTGIGMVTMPFFMTVLFVLLLPPFTLIRLKDPLRLKLKKDGSYWEPNEPHEATIDRMQRLF